MTYIVFFGSTDCEDDHGANSIYGTYDTYDDVMFHISQLRRSALDNTFIHVHHVESKTSWDMKREYVDPYTVIDEDKSVTEQVSYPNLSMALHDAVGLRRFQELHVVNKNTGDVYLVKRY